MSNIVFINFRGDEFQKFSAPIHGLSLPRYHAPREIDLTEQKTIKVHDVLCDLLSATKNIEIEHIKENTAYYYAERLVDMMEDTND